jgi:hypothetical protein
MIKKKLNDLMVNPTATAMDDTDQIVNGNLENIKFRAFKYTITSVWSIILIKESVAVVEEAEMPASEKELKGDEEMSKLTVYLNNTAVNDSQTEQTLEAISTQVDVLSEIYHLVNKRACDFGFKCRVIERDGKRMACIFQIQIGFAAHEAGLRDGDLILAVDGESLEAMSESTILAKLAGKSDQIDLLIVKTA